jgi:flavin prenyltransferase
MRLVVAITGASGSLYAQRLLDSVDGREHELHVILSRYAHVVIAEELGQTGCSCRPGRANTVSAA